MIVASSVVSFFAVIAVHAVGNYQRVGWTSKRSGCDSLGRHNMHLRFHVTFSQTGNTRREENFTGWRAQAFPTTNGRPGNEPPPTSSFNSSIQLPTYQRRIFFRRIC